MGNRSRATKVGYSVISAVLLLVILVVGGSIYLHLKYSGTIYLSFPTVGSLHMDDELTIQGISYGKIEKLNFIKDGRAIADIKLSQPVKIYEGYRAFVGDRGIFGDRVIYIENGPVTAPVISRNDTLSGAYYPAIPELLGSAHKMKEAVENIRIKFHQLYSDSAGYGNFFSNFREIVERSDKFVDRLYIINSAISNLKPGTMESLVSVSKSRKIKLDKLQEDIDPAIDRVNSTISSGDDIIKKLVKVEEKSKLLLSSIEQLDTLAEFDSLSQSLMDLEDLFETIYRDAHNLRLILVKDKKD
jgi:hypothetical protein